MSLLTALRPLAVQKAATMTAAEAEILQGAILGPPGPFGIPQIDDLWDQLRVFKTSALVYRAATIWAEETIQVPLRIFSQAGRRLGPEVLDGPVWDLLGEVNGFQAWPEFLYVTMLNLALTGNAFWWKVRNRRGVPVELWSLKPTEIRTERVGDTAALQYRWFPTEIGHPTAGYLFDQSSIVHLRLPSPLSDVWGMAPVRPAADDIRADQQAKRSTLGMMDNSALPAGVLTSQQDIGEEQAAIIRRQWREVYGGPSNTGRIAVLGRGTDFKPIAVQPKDLEYLNQRKFSRAGILAAFGTPPIYFGVESENFGNRREQRRQLWQDKLVPLFRLLEGQISERLLRDFDPSYVAILDEMRTDVFVEILGTQMDTADKVTRARLMTPNEARQVFIQPFLRDVQGPVIGGDDFLVPLNMVPSKYISSGETLGWAEARIEQRAPGAPKAPETPAQAEAIAGTTLPDITGTQPVKKALAGNDAVPALARALHRVYAAVASDLADSIGTALPTDTTLDHHVPSPHAVTPMVAGALTPHLSQSYQAGLAHGERQINSQVTKALGDPEEATPFETGVPSLFDPAVAEFVRTQVALYSPLIAQDMVDAFRQELADGLALGEDITTLQNRLMQFADLQAPARALRVARTEIADAQNAGAMASYQRNDQVEQKKWVTARDSHVRPAGSRGGPVFDHRAADGQIVAKDQPFVVSGERMMYPGDRSHGASPGNYCNCRCVVVPIVRSV